MRTLAGRLRAELQRPGARLAAGNFGWLMADRLLRLVTGVCVGFLVVRHLGPERFGELSYELALAGILAVLVEGGLEAVVRRDLLRRPEAAGKTLLAAGVLRLALAVAVYACLLGAGFGGLLDPGPGGLLFIVGALVFQPALMLPELWFQARLDVKTSLRSQWAVLVAGAALRLGLILRDAPLALFGWVALGEGLLAGLLLLLRARKSGFRLEYERPLRALAGALWRDAWPLLLSSLSVGIYMRVDAVMLKYLAGEAEVGIYAAATRLSELWYFAPVALATSLLPALLRAKAEGAAVYAEKLQRYFDLSAAGAYLLATPLALLAGPLVRLVFGEAYAQAGPILAVHVWASVFVFLGVARGQWLVNEGFSRFYLWATLAGALANVALNLVLIPRFGGLGAAWATVVSYAGAAWVSSYCNPGVRAAARLQTNALLVPLRAWSHLLRR